MKQAAHGFVDDMTASIHGKDIKELRSNLQEAYDRMEKYLKDHRMIINGKKTQLCVMSRKKEDKMITIEAEGSKIHNQDHMKILGVTISGDSKFDQHLWKGKDSVISAVNKKAAMIRVLKPYLNEKKTE